MGWMPRSVDPQWSAPLVSPRPARATIGQAEGDSLHGYRPEPVTNAPALPLTKRQPGTFQGSTHHRGRKTARDRIPGDAPCNESTFQPIDGTGGDPRILGLFG